MDRIKLPRAGRETIYLSMHARPAFATGLIVEVQQVGDVAWVPATNVVVTGDRITAEVLVNGPDFIPDGTASIEIDADSTLAVRFQQYPEVIVRDGVYIALVD